MFDPDQSGICARTGFVRSAGKAHTTASNDLLKVPSSISSFNKAASTCPTLCRWPLRSLVLIVALRLAVLRTLFHKFAITRAFASTRRFARACQIRYSTHIETDEGVDMKLTEQTISLLQEARDGRDLGIICKMKNSDPPEEVRKNRLCQFLVAQNY